MIRPSLREPVFDEPLRHRWFLILVGVMALGAAPLWFVGRETVFVAGLPLWLWSSMAFTAGLAVVTAWAMLRWWRDDDRD